jgi:hypothetical protein
MALDLTHTKERPGPVIYFISDGTESGEIKLKTVLEELLQLTQHQCIWLGDVRSHDAAQVIDFYDLVGSEFVVIVREDDQLHHVWSNGEIIDASTIAYHANQLA